MERFEKPKSKEVILSMYEVVPNQQDLDTVEVRIKGAGSASFRQKEDGKLVCVAIEAFSGGGDMTAEEFIGPNRLRNAEVRAMEYFNELKDVSESDSEPEQQDFFL